MYVTTYLSSDKNVFCLRTYLEPKNYINQYVYYVIYVLCIHAQKLDMQICIEIYNLWMDVINQNMYCLSTFFYQYHHFINLAYQWRMENEREGKHLRKKCTWSRPVSVLMHYGPFISKWYRVPILDLDSQCQLFLDDGRYQVPTYMYMDNMESR